MSCISVRMQSAEEIGNAEICEEDEKEGYDATNVVANFKFMI